jgi:hypothetical protein
MSLQNRLECYLKETFGISIEMKEWQDVKTLPYGMRSSYDFYKIDILGTSFLLLDVDELGDWSIARLTKHADMLMEKFHEEVIYHFPMIESFQRRELIKKKFSFIVGCQQCYLPNLGIDLRERVAQIRTKKKKLTPYAQVTLIAAILRPHEIESGTVTSLSETLKTTKMTMSRAIDELESQGALTTESIGREKHIRLKHGHLLEEFWPLLSTPVQKKVYLAQVEHLPMVICAGLSALSRKTMLVEPKIPVVAISKKDWSNLEENSIMTIIPESAREMAQLEVEIWRYDPSLLATEDTVDALSLYLSLQDMSDERVEGELEKIKAEFKW